MKKLIPAFLVTFFFCFMVFLYEPILMYATNIDDFWFDLEIMIKPVLIIFIILLCLGCLLFSVLYLINKFFSKDVKGYKIVLLFTFLAFFATYIQGNYLVTHLPSLDGRTIDWTLFTKDNIITFIMWLVLAAILIISLVKLKLDKTIKYATYISVAVFIMLLVSLTSTLVTTDAFLAKDGINITEENINTISKDKNFLIFLVDAVDSMKFKTIIESNQDYKNMFNDFTYYPDTLSAYPYTRDSIPYILSGQINKNETSFGEYSSNALNNSLLFRKLDEKDYKINLYDDELIWNGNRNFEIKNIVSTKDSNVNLEKFFKQELKYVLFKYLPYNLKKYSRIEHMDFKTTIEKFKWNDDVVYQTIIENQNLKKESSKQFQFIHTEGAHVPYNFDRNLNKIENGTYGEKVEATIKLMNSYLERLKKNGTYDNSVIILMADHGFDEQYRSIQYRFNPILLIKGINEKHEMLESKIPISYFDLPTAYEELLKDKKSTELFQNIDKNRTREMIWYEYSVENHMVEYETKGSATEVEKYNKTGNVYDR